MSIKLTSNGERQQRRSDLHSGMMKNRTERFRRPLELLAETSGFTEGEAMVRAVHLHSHGLLDHDFGAGLQGSARFLFV